MLGRNGVDEHELNRAEIDHSGIPAVRKELGLRLLRRPGTRVRRPGADVSQPEGRLVWLTLLDVMAHPDDVYTRPETAYFRHPAQVDLTWFLVNYLYRGGDQDRLRRGLEDFQRPLTKAFHDKGGKLLAGSDALLPGLLAGFDLRRELQALVAVGLTPYEALRTATTNPFEYLGESDKAGTIAVGKRTDLLLVDANPLEDISAASHIGGVLMRGRWIGAEELQQTMQAIVAAP